MKKKIFFLVLCLMGISFCASAQIKFGVTAGAPFKLSSLNINDAEIENSRPFNLGVVCETIFPPFGLGFEVSALYEMENITGKNIVDAVNVGYLIIPANFKWKVGIKPLKFFLKAGPSFSIKLHDSGNIVISENGVSLKNYEPKPFNWGLNVGAGFEVLSRIQAGVSYFYNFSKPFKEIVGIEDNQDNNMTNQGGFVVSLAYFF